MLCWPGLEEARSVRDGEWWERPLLVTFVLRRWTPRSDAAGRDDSVQIPLTVADRYYLSESKVYLLLIFLLIPDSWEEELHDCMLVDTKVTSVTSSILCWSLSGRRPAIVTPIRSNSLECTTVTSGNCQSGAKTCELPVTFSPLRLLVSHSQPASYKVGPIHYYTPSARHGY
jgi:hypothetical protein